MANTLLTPQIIAREALMVLYSQLVMGGLVHKDFSNEFQRNGDTITVRKPSTFSADDFTGEIVLQEAAESSVEVKLNRHKDVSFPVTSAEMTLSIQDFSQQLIVPAMEAVVQAVDIDLFGLAADVSNAVSVTASPADLTDFANLEAALNINKIPAAGRSLILTPRHKAKYIKLDAFTNASARGDTQGLREASMGRVMGFDTFGSNNALYPKLSTGNGTATAAKATGVVNEKKLTLSEVSAATGTLKIGDKIVVNGRVYTVGADFTAVAGGGEVTTVEKVPATFAVAATCFLVTKDHSLGFHKNAFALVTRPLALPMGGVQAEIINYKGLGLRVVYDYNSTTKKNIVSIDILYGIKTLNADMAVRLA